MTEIPEHLLKRSKERKAALSGDSPTETSETAAESAESTAVASVADAPPATTEPAAVPAVAPEPEPERVPPYVERTETRKKLPYWIVPVLLALPVWGAMYVGTLERVPQGLTGLLGEGESLYLESGCSGCHGAEGGGGIGPSLAGGDVHLSFTSIEDQVVWIAKGSNGVGAGQAYTSDDSTRPRSVAGQMPGFAPMGGNSAVRLSAEEILAVTLYERTQFEPGEAGDRDIEISATLDELLATGELELPETYDAASITADDVAEWIAPALELLSADEG